jgi:hypothetical protein
LCQDDILDILGAIAVGEIVVTAAIKEADAANIDRLLADRDLAPPDIDIRVAGALMICGMVTL